MEIANVAEETYRIEIFVPNVDTLFSIYFIKEGGGVLIEPGPASTIPFIEEAMKQLGMKDLAYVIPTHIHIDHGGAVGKLAEKYPNAKIVIHPRGAKHVIDPERLIKSTKMAFGDDYEKRYGPIVPVPESQMLIPEDGEKYRVNGRDLQVIYSPGHAPHHLAIFDLKTRGLFSGESLGVPKLGPKPIPLPAAAPPSFDIEDYLSTIEKLKSLMPKTIFYSHDGTGEHPDELISIVIENTKAMRDIMGNGLKEGATEDAIRTRLKTHFSQRFQIEMGEMDGGMTFNGFLHYFERKLDNKPESNQSPDISRVEALKSLPSEILRSLSKEEMKAFLYEDEWPDSLREKLKDYMVE